MTSTFPTRARFWRGAFVRNFCLELAGLGTGVEAIVPEGWHAVVWGWFNRAVSPNRSGGGDLIPTTVAGYPSFSIFAGKNRYLSRIDRRLCQAKVERVLDRFSEKPDLVYAHFMVSALLVRDWCKRNGVKLAVISGESSYGKFLAKYDRPELREALDGIDHLFFVSERNRDALAAFLNLPEVRGEILPNGVDSQRFRPVDKAECRKRLGLPSDRIICVFVGYFEERKGPLRVLDALKSSPGVAGVFIGRGEQMPAGPQVLRAGLVENEEMPVWLSSADMFVLPSLEEGRSNAVLEAMACGLPLVVSDRDFNREFLMDDCAVFVEPGSVEAIGNAVRQLAGSPETRERMGRAARARSLDFSLRKRAEKFLASVQSS